MEVDFTNFIYNIFALKCDKSETWNKKVTLVRCRSMELRINLGVLSFVVCLFRYSGLAIVHLKMK